MDSDSDEIGFGDDYNMVIYNVPFAQLPKDIERDPVAFLEQHGHQCGEEIPFPPGKVFHFFECFKELTSLDVLQLVGGGRVGGPYPNEDELSCGGLEREVAVVLVAKINHVAKLPDEDRARVLQKAKDNFLDPKWFVNTLFLLRKALEESLQRGGSVMALFE